MLFAGRGRKGGEERGRAPRAESEKTAEGDPRRGIKGKGEGQRQAVAERTGAEGDGGERTEGDERKGTETDGRGGHGRVAGEVRRGQRFPLAKRAEMY